MDTNTTAPTVAFRIQSTRNMAALFENCKDSEYALINLRELEAAHQTLLDWIENESGEPVKKSRIARLLKK